MGLLEKAQQKKHNSNKTKDATEPTIKIENAIEQVNTTSLMEIAKQREKHLSEITKEISVRETTEKQEPSIVKLDLLKNREYENKEIIDERKGFGWKGLGSRKIVYDKNISEYIYEVSEPNLNKNELEIIKELSHLFKMLADVNISSIENEDREKHLEETLEQIVIDNNINFYIKEEKDKTSKKSFKDFLHVKSKNNNEEVKLESDEEKNPESISSNKSTEKKIKTKEEREKEKEEIELAAKESKDKIFYHLFREFIGYGPIDIVMKDDGIEDISCDGHHVPIFLYHKKYEAISTNIRFENEEHLNSFVVRLAQICGKQISIYSPIVDGKLPDGSRLQTTLARTVTKGSTFTIRRFRENPLTPIDLIEFKSLSTDMAAYFWMALENGASVLFCGGTASGKTTALNALSLFIPSSHKIITIEDTREISLPHKNWIADTTRQGFSSSEENKTGKDIDMFDLIRAALRQRPKVVMVGEVRGKEAYSLFQAMATGHTAYSTIHASTIHTLIQRLENDPISLPRALLTSLDIIVFQNAIDIGEKTVRRMTSVTEVIKLDPDSNQLIFMEPFKWISKTDDRFENNHSSKVLNNIKAQNNWNDKQLNRELDNRKTILEWMRKKNIRDYIKVGKIVSEYKKHPEVLLKKAEGEMNK